MILFPFPTQYNGLGGEKKLQVVVYNTIWGGGGVGVEARQVKLYLRLAGAQKRQKCKFVPRLLSMIVDWGAEMKTN